MRVILTVLAVAGLGFAWQFGFADVTKEGAEGCSGAKCLAQSAETCASECSASACSAGECSEKKCCSEQKCSSEKACCSEKKCCSEQACSSEQKCSSEKACASKCEGSECTASQCASKCSGSECSSQCASKCDSEKATCCAAVAAAKKQLPKMSYLVGTESVCCSQMASELADKNQEKVQYVVAEKTYCCKESAFTALVEETEKFVKAFTTPSSCQVSGKTSVAGQSFSCSVAAGNHTKLVSTAVKGVRMGYKVGDEEVCCVKHATKLAQETNAPIHYIAGGEATPCELTARLKLATAQYVAAVSALAAAESADSDTTASLEKVSQPGSDS
jgi:hypothetical protein